MSADARQRITMVVNALRNAHSDSFADAKYKFALAGLQGKDSHTASRIALPTDDLSELGKTGIYPSQHWPHDELVRGFRAILRAECEELYRPTPDEFVRMLFAKAEDRSLSRIERGSFIRMAAEILHYIPTKAAK